MPETASITPANPLTETDNRPLHVGRHYLLTGLESTDDRTTPEIIGDYRLSTQAAEIVPAVSNEAGESAGFLWNPELDLRQFAGSFGSTGDTSRRLLSNARMQTNRLHLKLATLDGPKLEAGQQDVSLSLASCFEFDFATDAFGARLGMLHLVQGRRFLILESGEQLTLMDTGEDDEPVLYVPPTKPDLPLCWISPEQDAGLTRPYTVSVDVAQNIPNTVGGELIVSVTVLERYIGYVLQRAVPERDSQTIWTPLHAPLSWGWSVRAERRSDGDWAVVRRKLMLPTSGDFGLQLPLWLTNSAACSPSSTPEA